MFYLGLVAKAFGIKGGVTLKLLNKSSLYPGLILNIKNKEQEDLLPFTICEVIGQNNVIFEEIKTRNEAESLKGAQVFVNRAHLAPLLEDEYYLADLIGAKILDASNNFIGEVTGLSHNNAQDLLVINTSGGKEAFLPLIKPFVTDIDLIKKQISIDAPKELFNL